MSEQEQRQHPYAYNLRFATKDLESHERIAYTVADAMIHAKEFDTMHQRITALETELASAGHEKSNLNDELYRVRTIQQASAHALDRVRQYMGLDLIEGEHPSDTAGRIESELAATKRECEGLREAARETPNRIRELSQFVDPKHHEKFHQLADVMETLMPEAARDATEGGA